MKKPNFIQKFIQSIGLDKKDHNILGQITGFPAVTIGLIIDFYLNNPFYYANLFGIICVIAYALKEIIHDKILGKGKMEFLDWWYNSQPVFEFLIIINLILIYINK